MAHVDEGEDDDCGVSLGSKILELKKINLWFSPSILTYFVPW